MRATPLKAVLPLVLTFTPIWTGPLYSQSPAPQSAPVTDPFQSAYKISLKSPADYQVFQRTTSGEGTILLEGTLTPPRPGLQPPDRLQARIVGAAPLGKWEPISFDPRVQAFRSSIKAPSGGWYQIEIRAITGNQLDASVFVDHVGVGEVFVVAGQSNSANHSSEKLVSANPQVATMVMPGKWQPCQDPQPGASGSGGSFIPSLGDALASKHGVPIGFVCSGVGATSVREWMPKGVRFSQPPTLVGRVLTVGNETFEADGQLYQTFTDKLRALGPNGFRAVLWHQGESDANQSDPARTLPGHNYRALLETLIRSSRSVIGWEAPWFVAQVSYHVPGDEFSPDIRLAQRMLWESGVAIEGPDSDALTGPLRERNGAGVHFSGEGQREHAARWAQKISPWLEAQIGAPAGTTTPRKGNLPVRLAPNPLFSDRMVLQQGRPAPVWGSAPPGEEVTVAFANQTKTAKADGEGRWQVQLDPVSASEEPRSMTIRSASGNLVLKEILVGEVWLASGQSNMQWTLSPRHGVSNGAAELEAASDTSIRQFTVKKSGSGTPLREAEGAWHRANKNELLVGGPSGDSAVGYFFARELRKKLGVPVGILNASVGGTPIERWTDKGELYNAMVHPLAPFAIQGAIWYQGESNCLKPSGAQYTELQTGMVKTWRALWKQGEFPFFYVQIAPYLYARPGNTLTPDTLGEFWMAQTAAMHQPNTGMVVINDITENPSNIHPPNKQDVGKRLAGWALGTVYHKTDTQFKSPLFSGVKVEGAALRVRFENADGGLQTSDGKSPSHLEVAGEDGVFHPASGTIEGAELVVQSESVASPKHVRYGWAQDAMPNLGGKTGLPVAPFHSAKWPLSTTQPPNSSK